MSFESFRAKVRASALKAAEAAMSVSSLDQMAADDEYIHSEGLKVSKSKDKKTATASQQLNELLPLPSTEQVQHAQQLQPFPAKPPITSQSSLHVADAVRDRQRRPTQPKKYDDDEGSDDDDDDLIMSMIRRTPATVEPRPNKTKLKQGPPNPGPVHVEHIPRKKNPNRFMSDLDDRLSKVEEARPEATIPKQQTSSAPSAEQKNSWNLLQSAVTTSSIGQFLSQKLAVPIAATDEERKRMKGPLVSRRDHGADKDDHEEEDPFLVVVSSSVLGADEAAELERMRLATQQSTGPCAMVWQTIRQNPHHAFIVFTLLLGSAAYFYSRHRGSEDDVS